MKSGSTIKRTLLYAALPAATLATAYALWPGNGPLGTSAAALAAVSPGTLELDPGDASETIQPEDLLAVPVAERQPEALSPDHEGELAATKRAPRRETVAAGEGSEGSPILNLNDNPIQILNGRLDASMPLIISREQTFQIYSGGEIRFTNVTIGSVLEDGLNSTEHSPGVPASQGYVTAGLKTGMWTTWHANGKKESEGPFTYGQMHGRWTTWHDSGEKASEGEYLYGKREGPWVEYHANGKKRETATYVNGQRDGRVTTWHVNGARKSEMFYSFGRQHLESREWYVNGQESRRATFEYGQQVGRLRVWNSDGTLDEAQSGVYEDGQKVRD